MSRPLTAVLALFPVMATAQGYEGAMVDLQYQRYDDGAGFEVDSIEGTLDAGWQLGRVGVQVGLVLGKGIDSSADIDFDQYNGLAVHMTTDLGEAVRLGGMVAADNQADGIFLYAAEALYLSGPVRIEGRVGDSFDNSNPYGVVEVKGAYALGSAFSARARLHYSDFGADGHYGVVSLGAGYKLNRSTEVYADLSRHKNDFGPVSGEYSGSLVNLGVRFGLGGTNTDRMFTYQPLN